MTNLLNKLQAAEAGSRELDLLIWAHFGGWKLVLQEDQVEWRAEKYDGDVVEEWITVAYDDFYKGMKVNYSFEDELPAYSSSLDEALSLVRGEMGEVEHGVDYMILRGEKGWRAYIGVDRDKAAWSFGSGGSLKANPALAVCCALLLATDTGGGGDE